LHGFAEVSKNIVESEILLDQNTLKHF